MSVSENKQPFGLQPGFKFYRNIDAITRRRDPDTFTATFKYAEVGWIFAVPVEGRDVEFVITKCSPAIEDGQPVYRRGFARSLKPIEMDTGQNPGTS